MARGSKLGSRFKLILFLLVAGGLAYVGVGAFRAGPPPQIRLEAGLPAIGKSTPFAVEVSEPKRGLTSVRVEVEQGDLRREADVRTYVPLTATSFWGERTKTDAWTVAIGSETIEGLQPGKATVRVIAERAGAWLRAPAPVVFEETFDVRLIPPTVAVLSNWHYLRQGGCEAVVYDVGSSAVRDGVEAGGWFFPGYPLPDGPETRRFALFAWPYDLADPSGIRLVAEDDVGNLARVSFLDKTFPRPPARDVIPVSDRFMQMVVPPILAQTPELRDTGDLLQNYVQINNDLRRANAETIVELAARSAPKFLWNAEFASLPNAAVRSAFADHRTYVYQGAEVDTQDHLGYDLASTAQAPIPSAGDGQVVLARYLGIYGNAVVVDHGYGLMSLYGHLSSFAVAEGDVVTRGQSVGRTGTTGLAAGDHLHFTMLLQGLPVDPKEWWDGHWIRDRLKNKLGAALPFGG